MRRWGGLTSLFLTRLASRSSRFHGCPLKKTDMVVEEPVVYTRSFTAWRSTVLKCGYDQLLSFLLDDGSTCTSEYPAMNRTERVSSFPELVFRYFHNLCMVQAVLSCKYNSKCFSL